MIAYRLDRRNEMSVGQTIGLQIFNDIKPPFLNSILHKEYPQGLTSHGDQFYASTLSANIFQSAFIESIFEYERRLKFPDKISRFQAIFASETVNEATKWAGKLKTGDFCDLYEIEFDNTNTIKVDASWLAMGESVPSLLYTTYYAEQYWSGAFTDNPIFELLIIPPARVLRKITLY
ncbi:hypothetical protein BSK49_19135 [Paenibacillus odorifer]|uniref:DUF2441 domain-containing protein n=1 Tax=Paenibacillus odorifer TaxID=189426 RepID=A0ABX3GR26_9BACL|nr:hypothetical protein [Paenibacillus odorifer]OMD34657.1 hypothetical protein BSO21_10860 [Paenibacillus odorifer]OMD85632.1 hypothetical protein BSK49_19135 [Paenibacillus odorifer]